VKQHQSIMQASSSMLQLLPKRRAKTRPCKDASEEAERKSSGKLWKKKSEGNDLRVRTCPSYSQACLAPA